MPRERINAKTKMGDPWATLSSAIKDTLQKKETDLRLSMIHKACTVLVTKGQYDIIFNGLSDLLKQHFEEWHKQLQAAAGDPLLTILTEQYESFKDYCSIFPKFYMSYDRHFQKETPSKTLNQIRKLFISIILSDLPLFKEAATPSILSVIHNAQKGSDIDLSKVSTLIEMYYSFRKKGDKPEIFEDFMDKLNEQESNFYDQFFENNFKSRSFPDYLNITSKQFILDKRIAEEILDPKEVFDFLSNFQNALLSSREEKFLDGPEPPISEALLASDLRPLKWLVETYQQFSADLSPIYKSCANYIKNQMLKKTQDFPEVKKEDKNKQKEDGKESAEPKAKAPKINIFAAVGQLMDLTLKLKTPYLKIFTSKEAEKALTDSIKLAWNDERFNIVNSFNDYIDSLVKDEFKSSECSQEEQNQIISQFYGYLSDKAKFNVFYESAFVRRLIKMRSKSAQYDYPIINTIRKISPDFMLRLDDFNKQFNDSEQLKDEFKRYVAEDPDHNKVSVEPFVFNFLTFPLPKDEERNVPALALDSNNKFKSFYTEKHKQSLLVLVSSCSSCEFSLKITSKNHPSKTYTISTDLSCGCVLSAVSQKTYKYSEIIQLLNNEKQLASKVVLRLVENRLLSRKAETKKLSDDDEFSLNTSFTNQKTKLIIPPVNSEKKAANKISASKDEIEKKDAINAAIVRILKQKRKLEIGLLETTVIEILHKRFECTSEMIRRGVTFCEGNNYIKRDIDNGQTIITYIG